MQTDMDFSANIQDLDGGVLPMLDLAGTVIAARRPALEKELDRLLKTATACPLAKALRAKLQRASIINAIT